MNSTLDQELAAQQIAEELRVFVQAAVQRAGSNTAKKPAHREPFHWPPHPVSYSYHVLASDWTGRAEFAAHGETFPVEVARTPYGVFGRSAALWHEDRGDTEQEMLANLAASAEPLFRRQLQISETLGRTVRFTGHIRDLCPLEQLQLLYCDDRDVANEAQTEIETHASSGLYFPSLVTILDDRSHPNRRSAQWCVLDLFEGLPSFCKTKHDELEAVRAMRDLIWSAEDDYARTIYKAGVVLGGHVPYQEGGRTLIECLRAPSKIGRRSAIHGLFHVVEWIPEMRDHVLASLRKACAEESEPSLMEFCQAMAADIEEGNLEHVQEPLFPEEF
jgi:hypothetical protein